MTADENRRGTRRRRPRSGIDFIYDPRWNKGTGFTEEERDKLNIRGLLPPRVFTQEEQEGRILENFRRKGGDLDKYIFLIGLQDRNQTAFYRTVIDNIEEMLPIIYTPTVGEACQKFAHIFRRPRGLYVTAQDRGRVQEVLSNWPERDIAVVVVTDGERILGLGDLGANGMGIPIGKLSLYTACAGIHPSRCLPVMLDVGTENEQLRNDALYLGLSQPRLRGQEYEDLVEEFMIGVQEVFPGAVVQFEDFATSNAVNLLEKYRDRVCTFNDDIQGTAAVTLAGLFSAARITGRPLSEETIVFLGAGSAATGIAHLIVCAMVQEGMAEEEAYRRIWFVDSKGLVVKSRTDSADHKIPFAHDHEFLPDLPTVCRALKPSTLIGMSGQPATFTEEVVKTVSAAHERPVVCALSNPTSRSECTAEQAYRWSDGRAVFASGSPFDPVELDGKTFVPGQGNNAYIFPGLGLGVVAAGAKFVTDDMFLTAGRVLANMVTEETLSRGSIYPPLTQIRAVSAQIAAEVAVVAQEKGLATKDVPDDALEFVREQMYDARYEDYVSFSPSELREHFGNIDIYLFDQIQKGRITSDMTVLDAGCGDGRNLVYLMRSGFTVFGVDGSADAIQAVRNVAAELAPDLPPDNFQIRAVDALPFPDAEFDVVLCNAVLHFARDDGHFHGMLSEVWRVLAPRGLFFCRLASSIGIEDKIQSIEGRRHRLPDGSDRFLVDEAMLLNLTDELGGELLDPIKTTVVQGQRAMTTWVVRKR